MSFVRVALVSAFALVALTQSGSEASADHRWKLKLRWPKIYAPTISGSLYRDESEDVYDDEDEPLPVRKRTARTVYQDWESDFEPVYEEPPKHKVKKKKAVAKTAKTAKPAAKTSPEVANVVKPKKKVKPLPEVAKAAPVKIDPPSTVDEELVNTPEVQTATINPDSAILVEPKIKTAPQVAKAAPAKIDPPPAVDDELTIVPKAQAATINPGSAVPVEPKIKTAPQVVKAAPAKIDPPPAVDEELTIVPKAQAATVVPDKKPVAAPKVQTAAVEPSKVDSIGCRKGVDIITGYGFSGVKAKSCEGTAYTFNATRANSSYLIKLSAATGEITDVRKLQ